MIEFSCWHCGNRLRAPEARIGSHANCPKCRRDVMIPAASVAAAPSTEPPPVATEPAKASAAGRLGRLVLAFVLIVAVLLASLWIGMAWRAGSMDKAPKSVGEFWDRLMQRPAEPAKAPR